MNTVLSSILLLGCVRLVDSASSGAKDSACSQMYPLHSGRQQTIPPPFKILVTSTSYGCDGPSITVTIKANDLDGFRGFLCQPRSDVNVYQTFGTFESISDSITNNCEMATAATHTEPSLKTSVSFLWVPPDQDVGTVFIVCTVVKNWTIFWHKVPSEGIQHTDTCLSPTSSPTLLSTQTTTTNATGTVSTPSKTTTADPTVTNSKSSSTSEYTVSRISSVTPTTTSLSTENRTLISSAYSSTEFSNTGSTSTQAHTEKTKVTIISSTLSSTTPSPISTTVHTASNGAESTVIRKLSIIPVISICIGSILSSLLLKLSMEI